MSSSEKSTALPPDQKPSRATNWTAFPKLRNQTDYPAWPSKLLFFASRRPTLSSITDQANALDPTDEAMNRSPPKRNREAGSILHRITAMHLKLSSCNGSYLDALQDRFRQTGKKRTYLYGGLSTVWFFTRNTHNLKLIL